MTTYVVDTETTGEEPTPEVIELAIARLNATQWANGVQLESEGWFLGRFKPTGRIRFDAMAVHHILPHELEREPSSALAKAALPTDMDYMVGHNVDYDWNALGMPPCKRICTLAIARRIWPGNDGHGLSAMAYQLSSDLDSTREALRSAHSAGADVELCALILGAMYENPAMAGLDSWEALWKFSEDARLPRYWTFGKHKGDPLLRPDGQPGDAGYMLWVVRQADMDPYVKRACQLALTGQLTP